MKEKIVKNLLAVVAILVPSFAGVTSFSSSSLSHPEILSTRQSILLSSLPPSQICNYDDEECECEEQDDQSLASTDCRFTIRDAEREATRFIGGDVLGSWNQTTFEEATALFYKISRMRHRQASITMERIIHRMVQEQASGSQTINRVLMIPLYETLITSWAKSGEVEGLERAQEILEYMMTKYQVDSADLTPITASNQSLVQGAPSRDSFNAVLWAFAGSGQPNAPANAVRFLSKWFKWFERGQCRFPPNTTSYSAVLFAYARHKPSAPSLSQKTSKTVNNFGASNELLLDNAKKQLQQQQMQVQLDNPKLVLGLLNSMEKVSKQYPSVKPDLLCYKNYFVAINMAANQGRISRRQRAFLAEAHLERMMHHPDPGVHPDCWAFYNVIRAWVYSNAEDAVERCEKILKLQEEWHAAKGYTPETAPIIISYNALIGCYGRSHFEDRAERVYALLRRLDSDANSHLPKPTENTYMQVLNALVDSQRVRAPVLAEQLLLKMEQKQRNGDPRIRVDVTCINNLFRVFAKFGSFDKAEAWLNKMRERTASGDRAYAPNRITFQYYLKALSMASLPDAIDKAEKVVQEMNEMHKQGYSDVKLDISTYSYVLHCFAISGGDDSLERCLALLDHLEELHAQGEGSLQPIVYAYNCCVNAAAKSTRPGKAKAALQILRRMQSASVGAEQITYNNVLNACAFSTHPEDDPDEVLRLALDVFKEMRENVGVNHITYLTMVRVVGTQVRDENQKWRFVQELVTMCANEGQLTKHVMHVARICLPPSMFHDLWLLLIDKQTGIYKKEFVRNVVWSKSASVKRFIVD